MKCMKTMLNCKMTKKRKLDQLKRDELRMDEGYENQDVRAEM